MTENKADKALRKVIVNFTNKPTFNAVISEDEMIRVDITDKLPGECYFSGITIDRGEGDTITLDFIYRGWLDSVVRDIDTVLDATLVNSKQRESVGKLIKQCIYKEHGHWLI